VADARDGGSLGHQRSDLKPAYRSHRLSTLRILARYLIQQHPETYVPGPAPGLTAAFGFLTMCLYLVPLSRRQLPVSAIIAADWRGPAWWMLPCRGDR
jgi:hypothetical protein